MDIIGGIGFNGYRIFYLYGGATMSKKHCDFCLNAFNSDIEQGFDSCSISVGSVSEGYRMYINSSSCYQAPVHISVDTWREYAYYRGHKGCNVDIAIYAPKYCPECGRRIKENDKYRKVLEEKKKYDKV